VPFPSVGKEEVKASPPCGEGSLREKASPLAGRKWHTEGSGPVLQDKLLGCMARGSCQDLRVTPWGRAWETCNGGPLQQTCRIHHYRDRRGNDGLDLLVKSHRCSALDGASRGCVCGHGASRRCLHDYSVW
jgi:hypothetical protein